MSTGAVKAFSPVFQADKEDAMITNSTSINYMQLYSQYAAKQSGRSSETSVEVSVTIEETTSTETASQPQTIDDVKKEFYSYLDSLAISPGLSNTSISVNITEAAFEKMLVDPEYKQRMKDLCARDLCDPAWTRMAGMGLSPSASVITIDADCEEEYLASAYNSPSHRSKADGDSFWSRRTKKNKEAREDSEKQAAERKEMLEFLQGRAAERKVQTDAFFSGNFTSFTSYPASSAFATGNGTTTSILADLLGSL